LNGAGRRIFLGHFLRLQRNRERGNNNNDEQWAKGQRTPNLQSRPQARPVKQSATLLGAEPQVEPGSDSAFKGPGFNSNDFQLKSNRTVY
jgi:hypothetical protein